MKIKKQYVGWRGFFRGGPHPWKLAWARFGDPARAFFRPPFDRLFFGRARVAHEVWHLTTRTGNEGHHPWWHLCGRVGHGFRLFGRSCVSRKVWRAAGKLQRSRSVTVE